MNISHFHRNFRVFNCNLTKGTSQMLTLLKVTNFKPKISSLIFTKINWPYHCSRALKNPCWRDNIMCNKINVYTHCSFVSKINPQHLWTFDFFGWSLSFLTKLYKNHWLVCPKFRLSQLLDTAFPSYGTRSCLVVGHILDKKQKFDLNRGNSRSADASRVLSTVVTLIFLGQLVKKYTSYQCVPVVAAQMVFCPGFVY